MNSLATQQSGLQDIVAPVLKGMRKGPLRVALFDAFRTEQPSLASIEDSFKKLTSAKHERSTLRRFFASWSKTNNSAASVSGLANRITLMVKLDSAHHNSEKLYDVCSSLHRITDEDLGALGGMLHSDMFYNMATTVCDDDEWLLKSNCLKSAQDFKDWTDQRRLRDRDLSSGLLTTLVHEIYTHGEVEFIHPLFKDWVERFMGVPSDRVRHAVAWITVHTGGTESAHFGHAVNAVDAFCDVTEREIDETSACDLFCDYLRRKAAVMRECATLLAESDIGAASRSW